MISNRIDLGSKIVHKIITAVLWEKSVTADVIFFVNIATVLNKYLGLFLFSFKRDEKLSDPAFCMLFCRRKHFPAMQYEIPLVFFFFSCATFSGLLSLGRECAHYTTCQTVFLNLP